MPKDDSADTRMRVFAISTLATAVPGLMACGSMGMIFLDGGAEVLGMLKVDIADVLAKAPNLGGVLLFWLRATAVMGFPFGLLALWVAFLCPLQNRIGAHLCISLGFAACFFSHYQMLGGDHPLGGAALTTLPEVVKLIQLGQKVHGIFAVFNFLAAIAVFFAPAPAPEKKKAK